MQPTAEQLLCVRSNRSRPARLRPVASLHMIHARQDDTSVPIVRGHQSSAQSRHFHAYIPTAADARQGVQVECACTPATRSAKTSRDHWDRADAGACMSGWSGQDTGGCIPQHHADPAPVAGRGGGRCCTGQVLAGVTRGELTDRGGASDRTSAGYPCAVARTRSSRRCSRRRGRRRPACCGCTP